MAEGRGGEGRGDGKSGVQSETGSSHCGPLKGPIYDVIR